MESRLITPNTPQNQKIKYAWLRYKNLPRDVAKKLCRRTRMPDEFYEDLEKYFFYEQGRLILDKNPKITAKLCDKLLTFTRKRVIMELEGLHGSV